MRKSRIIRVKDNYPGVAVTETDEMLYNCYLNGEDSALRVLLERHRESLTFFLFGMVGNMDDAEDLMMDAFAALLAKDKAFDGKSSFKTWLFAIARNKAVSFLRSKHIVTVELYDNLLSEDDVNLQLLHNERRRVLLSAMRNLKTEYRQALLLSYFEEMSNEQVSIVMKIPKRKVSDLLYRSKQALKKELEREGYTDAELG